MKMKMILRSLTVLLSLFLSGKLYAQSDAAKPAEVTRLLEIYVTALSTMAEEYNQALTPIAEQYAVGLLQLAKRMQREKASSGAEAVRNEAQRYKHALTATPDAFEAVPELPPEHIVAQPEALRMLQEEYIGQRKLNELQLYEKCIEVSEKLVNALTQLHKKLDDEDKATEAAAAKKEATRLQVAMQRKDFSGRALQGAGVKLLPMPPMPDFAALSQRATTKQPVTRDLTALSLADLSAAVQAFLIKPLEYDKDWPPPITKWVYEGTGNYAHDFALYKLPGQPSELGIFAHAKTLRAYVRGTTKFSTYNFENKTLNWMGKAAAWQLTDSRDLVCRVIFRTKRPAISENGGPAGCVAVYSTAEGDRQIAAMSVPLLSEESAMRMTKHYSHNRLNVFWEGTKRKRGFTIPDHTPLRVVVGVVGYAAGEQIEATIEIVDCPQVEESW